jgi:putative ABC transport system permease protein
MIMTMADKPDVVREIVGVVGDVRPNGPQSAIGSHVYEPHEQRPQSGMQLLVKTTGPVPGLPEAVSRTFRELDPELPVRGLQPYEGRMANSWFRQRFSMILFTVFSGCALLLAALGIYGVMAYAVTQRTQEIGIRMALGAQARDVLGLMLGGGAKIVTLGVGLGLAGTLASARVLATLLYDTSPVDPVTLTVVAALLALVALLACWLPARRATRVNPLVALRSE